MTGRPVHVGEERLKAFQFESPEALQPESEKISPDGSTTGTVMVNRIDTPCFWAHGQIIVLCLGDSTAVVSQLTEIPGGPATAS